MKILFVCHEFPSPFVASSIRTFYFSRYLSRKYKHEITLLAKNAKEPRYVFGDSKECDVIETFKTSQNKLSPRTIVNVANNNLRYHVLFSNDPSFIGACVFPEMQRRVRELLERGEFDIAYADDLSMSFYLFGVNLPRVVDVKDAVLVGLKESIKWEKNLLRKLYMLFAFYRRKRWEALVYKERFDRWITVSHADRDALKSCYPGLDISVIPNGVDINYFTPEEKESNHPKLVYVGSMSSIHNVVAVRYFHKKIYPLIKQRIPDVSLYIVGRSPRREISKLAHDPSIVVTGWVNDIRPHLANASIVIAPMLRVVGILNKILEAMAMGKPIVSTSFGVRGIEVSPGENVVIADDPKEFAMRVIELLNNEEERRKIGKNARKLVESKYTWEKSADKLNKVIARAIESFR